MPFKSRYPAPVVLALSAALLAALAPGVASADDTTYDVGPGQPLASLGAVPWESLGPGDTVQVHWRPQPYHEKVLISTQGTEAKPIRLTGVPGPNNEPPIISGDNATTPPGQPYPFGGGGEPRGLLTVMRNATQPYGSKPAWIEISKLELRDATPAQTFTDSNGVAKPFSTIAAVVWVSLGEHVTLSQLRISNGRNGVFVSSAGDATDQANISSDFTLENSDLFGSGTVGGESEHQIYIEAMGTTIQRNRFGPLRVGAGGSHIKDRSAGTVVRYNR